SSDLQHGRRADAGVGGGNGGLDRSAFEGRERNRAGGIEQVAHGGMPHEQEFGESAAAIGESALADPQLPRRDRGGRQPGGGSAGGNLDLERLRDGAERG